jgi:hypothetical protein
MYQNPPAGFLTIDEAPGRGRYTPRPPVAVDMR